jgi:hypothetical protein
MFHFEKEANDGKNSTSVSFTRHLIIQKVISNENLMSGWFFVREAYFVHRCAPEVVEEDILDGRVRAQIAILLNRADVVEHEVAVE